MTENGPRGRWRYVIAVIMGLSGLVWVGQGIGLIGGSSMSDDAKWAYIGGVLIVGAILVAKPWRR